MTFVKALRDTLVLVLVEAEDQYATCGLEHSSTLGERTQGVLGIGQRMKEQYDAERCIGERQCMHVGSLGVNMPEGTQSSACVFDLDRIGINAGEGATIWGDTSARGPIAAPHVEHVAES